MANLVFSLIQDKHTGLLVDIKKQEAASMFPYHPTSKSKNVKMSKGIIINILGIYEYNSNLLKTRVTG